jgi:hypothetical protein
MSKTLMVEKTGDPPRFGPQILNVELEWKKLIDNERLMNLSHAYQLFATFDHSASLPASVLLGLETIGLDLY